MNLQRPELFKVCRTLGWRGDMRLLWQALDADSAGSEIECSKGKMQGIAFCIGERKRRIALHER